MVEMVIDIGNGSFGISDCYSVLVTSKSVVLGREGSHVLSAC